MGRLVPTLALALAGAHATTPSVAQDASAADAVLRGVDALRAPEGANFVERITIEPRTSRGSEPATRYEVRTRRGTGSLTQTLDGDGRGQKYLSTSAGFWFYAPRTRQAIRLTPSQLLRGQASVGDISRIQLASDYRATLQSDRGQGQGDAGILTLELTAVSPLATYARIRLTVERGTDRPIGAELFSLAGRRLKSVRFGPVATVSGRRVIQTTTYVDGVDPTKSTVVTIAAIDGAETPALLFRPQALGLDR